MNYGFSSLSFNCLEKQLLYRLQIPLKIQKSKGHGIVNTGHMAVASFSSLSNSASFGIDLSSKS